MGYFYSGRQHKTGKGYDYFDEMVKVCGQWWLRARWVSSDSWYNSIEHQKFLSNQEVGFLLELEANRIVSPPAGCYEQVAGGEHLSE